MTVGDRLEMKFGFIGAGRVGCSLGKYLKETDTVWELSGYYSRSIQSAEEAADFTQSMVYTHLPSLVRDCEVLLVTTPDHAIASVWEQVCSCGECLSDKIIVHCSGSMASTVFEGAKEHGITAASLHPFYAVADRYHSYPALKDALFTLEGSGERLEELDHSLRVAGLTIQKIQAQSKTRYHAAASVASNLMVGLTELAVDLLCECGFDREHARMALRPLMQGNLDAMMEKDTVGALTGPAERGDVRTVDRHLRELGGDDREIYRLLTKRIVKIAKVKNPERDYAQLEELLTQIDL